jgi:hypothetical protein
MTIREFLNSMLLGLSKIDSGALAAIYQRLPELRNWVANPRSNLDTCL